MKLSNFTVHGIAIWSRIPPSGSEPRRCDELEWSHVSHGGQHDLAMLIRSYHCMSSNNAHPNAKSVPFHVPCFLGVCKRSANIPARTFQWNVQNRCVLSQQNSGGNSNVFDHSLCVLNDNLLDGGLRR